MTDSRRIFTIAPNQLLSFTRYGVKKEYKNISFFETSDEFGEQTFQAEWLYNGKVEYLKIYAFELNNIELHGQL